MIRLSHYTFFLGAFSISLFSSCAFISDAGPLKKNIKKNSGSTFELVEVNSRESIPKRGRAYGQAEKPSAIAGQGYTDQIRERDSLAFIITDLSESSPFFTRGEPYKYGPIEVPKNGLINIPYVGEINVTGNSLSEISSTFAEKIKPVSNTAQVTVLRTHRFLLTANVLGEVRKPGPVPLERSGITSIDILAASGGPAQAEHLYQYTLRRGGKEFHFDYKGFQQNPFPIEAEDLLTVTTDATNRFQVMGAVYRPMSVPFPVPNPTLADAIGAVSGLDERRSDASGVFVFRKGNPDVVYTFNLKDPSVIPLAQRFPIEGEDIVYITEAPLSRWNRLLMQVFPLAVTQATNTASRY